MTTLLTEDRAFTAADDVLRELVEARREEVIRLQKTQADRLTDLTKRGEQRLSALRDTLPADLRSVLADLDKSHDEEAKKVQSRITSIKTQLASSELAQEEISLHPGLSGGHLITASALGWFTPYYGTLHGSDGTVYWQGYNPGNIRIWDTASGGGSGLFGTGAGSFTTYMDWWFTYRPSEDRNYANTIQVPFNGFTIVQADDGFWDSKEAHIRIDLSTAGYQYNWKAGTSTNVLDIDGQNINQNDRFDGWRTAYYSDLLGADQAYLRVTASMYVYARGGGSFAELNFNDGTANYLGVPWVYVN
jgi:hypothetical protein